MNQALLFLLLWLSAGAVALAICLYELRKYGTNISELVAYLQQQKSQPAFGRRSILALGVFLVVLGPISLTPIVLDAIRRLKVKL